MATNTENNSNILLGDKQHVIIVTGKDADDIRKYTDALGTTSLYNALEIISNPNASSIDKAKAIEDLIFIRLILSGSIQFKQPRLLGLVETVIGNNFKKLPKKLEGGRLVKELIDALEKGDKDVSVIKHFIILLIGFFGMAAIPAFGGLHAAGLTKYYDIIRPLKEELYSAIRARRFIAGDDPSNPAYTQYNDEVERAQHQLDSVGDDQSFILDFFLSNLNFMYPIIIGLIASMGAARGMINYENNIYTIALVKLIDRFLSSNMILDIINDPDSNFGLPKPLEGNQLGIALYFQYIKKIRADLEAEKINETEKLETERRTDIEVETGTVPLNISKFEQGVINDCAICLKPLAAAGTGGPIEVCKNKHMFHRNCIKQYIQSQRVPKCPMCREPILPAVITEAQRGGRRRRTLRSYKKRRSSVKCRKGTRKA